MQLSFGKRQGDHLNWGRSLVVRVMDADGKAVEHGPFWLAMATKNEPKKDEFGVPVKGPEYRFGEVRDAGGKTLWTGRVGANATPLRAFAVAAGLCDADGNSEIAVPDWLKS